MGHEIVGWMARAGKNASRRWSAKEGDRVVVESFIRCGYCKRCLVGDYRFCENGFSLGTSRSTSVPPHLWGAYAEYMYLPPGAVLHPLPEKVPPQAGVLVNAVLSNAIRWGRVEGNFSIGDAVVIQGVGPQGLALVVVAQASGCSPIIVTGLSRDSERFKLAREFGADFVIDAENESVVERVRDLTHGQMADVVVDVAANPKATALSIDLVKARGSVVVPTVVGTESTTSLPMDRMVHKDIKLIGVFSSDSHTVGRAIKLVESGRYPIEKMVTHTFPLEQAERAVQTAAGHFKDIYPIKCVIVP